MTHERSTAAKAVILAAGLGTRMRSQRPKVLHEVLGRPMVAWVVDKALRAGCEEVAVVVGYAKNDVIAAVRRECPDERVTFYEQTEMLGTGDAVRSAMPAFAHHEGPVLILCGDVPNVPAPLIERLLEATGAAGASVSLITAIATAETHYGRIVRDDAGTIDAIVEYKDADEATRAIREVNTGNYAVDAAFLRDGLSRLDTNNAQGEFYLTDLIAMAATAGAPAVGIVAPAIEPLDGVNTRADLGHANEVALRTARRRWMEAGVTMEQPSSVWLDATVQLEADATLEAHVSLRGATSVAQGSVVEAFCRLMDCTVERGARVVSGTIATGRVFSA